MKNYPHPIIAKEGWLFVALAILLALVVTVLAGWLWAIPLWLLSIFVLQFFRDPGRKGPEGEDLVVAPADGVVMAVEHTGDPYLKRNATKISVFMNVFNVHSNRSPVDGVVVETWYNKGRFFNAALDKSSLENERNALWIKTDSGWDVTSVQIAGLIARRIVCYATKDTRLHRGQRYGFIRFGSRVDVYLPETAVSKVSIGDKVWAGKTILAELPKK